MTRRQPPQLFLIGRRRALAGGLWLASEGLWLADARAADDVEFRVIVHPGNALKLVSREFLAAAFLKKASRWDDGETIRPVDLRADSWVRRRFSEDVLHRSVPAVRNYWQQRIFSGRDVPPPELDSEEAVVRYVAKYPGAVGYVSTSTKLAQARVLLLK